MKARIMEVCVGKPVPVVVAGAEVESSIFKQPVAGDVSLSLLNLAGDAQANLKYHGGRGKAVYVYSASHYPYWRAALNKPDLEPSQFGQNITVDGLADDEVRIGDIFQLGTAVVEVTQPRIPCAKLGTRLNDQGFATRFLLAGRLGYYLAVKEEGRVAADATMSLLQRADHDITIAALWQTVFTQDRDLALAEQALSFHYVDEGWKKRLRTILRADPL